VTLLFYKDDRDVKLPSFYSLSRVNVLRYTFDLSLPNAVRALKILLLISKSVVDVLERMPPNCAKLWTTYL